MTRDTHLRLPGSDTGGKTQQLPRIETLPFVSSAIHPMPYNCSTSWWTVAAQAPTKRTYVDSLSIETLSLPLCILINTSALIITSSSTFIVYVTSLEDLGQSLGCDELNIISFVFVRHILSIET